MTFVKPGRFEVYKKMHRTKPFMKNARHKVLYKDHTGRWQHNPLYYYNPPKMFDYPYITAVGKDENGIPWVRYQLLPAYMHGHRVNVVYTEVEVNPDGTKVRYPTNHFHCTRCKIMGGVGVLKRFHCID